MPLMPTQSPPAWAKVLQVKQVIIMQIQNTIQLYSIF